jgi:hypothetical protein
VSDEATRSDGQDGLAGQGDLDLYARPLPGPASLEAEVDVSAARLVAAARGLRPAQAEQQYPAQEG